ISRQPPDQGDRNRLRAERQILAQPNLHGARLGGTERPGEIVDDQRGIAIVGHLSSPVARSGDTAISSCRRPAARSFSTAFTEIPIRPATSVFLSPCTSENDIAS